MLIRSVAEHVVRRGLSNDNEQVIGPGKIKMKKPTQRAIYEMFFDVRIRVICHPDKPWERNFANPLNESLKKMIEIIHRFSYYIRRNMGYKSVLSLSYAFFCK